MQRDGKKVWIGFTAGIFALVLWTAWAVGTRYAVSGSLGVVELMLVRFGLAAVLLSPIWFRTGLVPRVAGWKMVALVAFGAGIGHLVVVSLGMEFAPAWNATAAVAAAEPLFVGLFAVLIGGSSKMHPLAKAALLAGLVLVMVQAVALGRGLALLGQGLFLLSAALWAVYTLAYARSGLSPFQAAALVSFWSLAGAAVLGLFTGLDFSHLTLGEVSIHAAIHGLGGSILGLVAYGICVHHLGFHRAILFPALMPLTVAAVGGPVLGEWPDLVQTIGIGLVTGGALIAARYPASEPQQAPESEPASLPAPRTAAQRSQG